MKTEELVKRGRLIFSCQDDDDAKTVCDMADRLSAVLKAWDAYEALPLVDKGPLRFGMYPAIEDIGRAITGEP